MIRLNAMVFIATACFALLDKFLEIEVEFYIYLGFFLFSLVMGLLLRLGYFEITKLIGLATFNILVFLVASSEPFSTGMHLHFVSAGAVALALYGYDQWKLGLLFVSLSLGLDLLAFTAVIEILPWRAVDSENAKLFFISNTLIAAVLCVYVFLLNAKLNYESEISLRNSEIKIKQQNDQLIKANGELDRFVYSASHDLRSPLSSLLGLINLSESEKEEKMRLEYLSLMRNRVKTMNSFINDIIDYSRNNRKELNVTTIHIKKFLEEIVEDLQYAVGWEKINFNWDVDDTLQFRCDDIRLKVVFNNLISNSIKYHDTTKKVSFIKLSASIQEKQMLIVLKDNGIGINPDLLPKIFEMFYRAHDYSTGSGLGLYIVQETLLKMGGSISVKSVVDEGSEFTITLPIS